MKYYKNAAYTLVGLQVLFLWLLVLVVVMLGACAAPGPRVDTFPTPSATAENPSTKRMLNPFVGALGLGVAAAGVAVLWPKNRQDA